MPSAGSWLKLSYLPTTTTLPSLCNAMADIVDARVHPAPVEVTGHARRVERQIDARRPCPAALMLLRITGSVHAKVSADEDLAVRLAHQRAKVPLRKSTKPVSRLPSAFRRATVAFLLGFPFVKAPPTRTLPSGSNASAATLVTNPNPLAN